MKGRTDKTTEHYLIVRIGKSETEVPSPPPCNNKRLKLTRQKASRGLSATAKLLNCHRDIIWR